MGVIEGVLVLVGDALRVVDDVLGEEDDEDDLQDDEERHVRGAPPVRKVEHCEDRSFPRSCSSHPVESDGLEEIRGGTISCLHSAGTR